MVFKKYLIISYKYFELNPWDPYEWIEKAYFLEELNQVDEALELYFLEILNYLIVWKML